MQIDIRAHKNDRRRVDFYGDTTEGIYIQLVNEEGQTYYTQELSELERQHLIDVLTRKDCGNAV